MIATNITTFKQVRGKIDFLDEKVVVEFDCWGLIGREAMEMKWKILFGRGKRGD